MTGFRHHAVFVDSEEELCRNMAESALDGLAADEHVVIHTDEDKRGRIARQLGDSVGAIAFHVGGRSSPTAALQGLSEAITALQQRHPGSRLRSIGQVRPDWSRPFRWMRYEAYVNELFAEAPLTGVCFYDTRFISDRVARAVEETHHRIGPRVPSSPRSGFRPPAEVVSDLPFRQMRPNRRPDHVFPAVADLRAVRGWVAKAAPRGRAEEAALVVHELAALALAGEGPPRVRLWCSSRRLVAEIGSRHCDAIRDPFAGLRPPDRGGEVGLWVAGHLCDDLVIGEEEGMATITTLFTGRH